MPKPFTAKQLEAGVKRLGKQRLLDECDSRFDAPSEGDSFKKMSATALATELATRLPLSEVENLAVEGMQRQKAPSVGGPSWAWLGDSRLNAGRVKDGMKVLAKRLPEGWSDVSAELSSEELFGGIVTLLYKDWELRPSRDGLVWIPAQKTALILLDYDDQVYTVSANSDEDALIVGGALGEALGGTPNQIELTMKPSIERPPLSPTTVQVLEAVYGRIDGMAHVINVDAVRTRRHDPNSPVKWQSARGTDNHVLVDEDVRVCLKRGDDLVGIAFQLDWTYKRKGEDRHFYTHVTLNVSDGPFTLRLTRGAHKLEFASALYVEIRRALSKDTDEAGRKRVKQLITEEVLQSPK